MRASAETSDRAQHPSSEDDLRQPVAHERERESTKVVVLGKERNKCRAHALKCSSMDAEEASHCERFFEDAVWVA